MWQGLADQLIFTGDSINYYNRALAANGGIQNTQSFFRYFLASGVAQRALADLTGAFVNPDLRGKVVVSVCCSGGHRPTCARRRGRARPLRPRAHPGLGLNQFGEPSSGGSRPRPFGMVL